MKNKSIISCHEIHVVPFQRTWLASHVWVSFSLSILHVHTEHSYMSACTHCTHMSACAMPSLQVPIRVRLLPGCPSCIFFSIMNVAVSCVWENEATTWRMKVEMHELLHFVHLHTCMYITMSKPILRYTFLGGLYLMCIQHEVTNINTENLG